MTTSFSSPTPGQPQMPLPDAASPASPLPPSLSAATPATTIDPASARPGLPVLPPPTAILEILLLIVVPAALDYVLPAFPSLSDMQPHLFWLPVLLVSLQYGTLSGLLAAGTAIAASSALGWSEQEIGENHFAYLIRVWSQPVLWLMAALVLGQFRMRQIERKQELARQVAELSTQRQAIAEYAGNLRDRCERLEREAAMQRSYRSRDVVAILGRYQNPDPEIARAAFQDSLQMTFGGCQASVFIRTGDELRLLHSVGWPANATWKSTFAADHPLAAAVTRKGETACVLTPGDEHVLGTEALVATPIRAPDDGRIIGMFKLEAADPSALDAGLVDRMMALAVQIAPLLQSGTFATGSAVHPSPSGAIPSHGAPSGRQRLWRQARWQRAHGTSPPQHRPTRTG